MTRRPLLTGALLTLLSGCTVLDGIDTLVVAGAENEFSKIRTFAFSSERASSDAGGEPLFEDALDDQVEASILDTLVASGLRRVAPADADVLIRTRISVFENVLERDPEWIQGGVDRLEYGRLEIAFLESQTRGRLWQGQAERRLRRTGVAVGVNERRYQDVDEERDWRLDAMARAVLERFPPVADS